MTPEGSIIPIERIQKCIYVIRGHKVMLDNDLAELYRVETKVLLQAVKRNVERFPSDFMFQLSSAEFKNLRSQIVTSSWGGRRYDPFAFTEQGISMLSTVLRSKRAIEINIAIMRTFVRLRQILEDNAYLRRQLEAHNEQIQYIFRLLDRLMTERKRKRPLIGYQTEMAGHKNKLKKRKSIP